MRRDPQMSFLQAWVRCFSRERKKEKKENLFWGFKLTTTLLQAADLLWMLLTQGLLFWMLPKADPGCTGL